MSLLRNYQREVLDVKWENADGTEIPVGKLERYHVFNVFRLLQNVAVTNDCNTLFEILGTPKEEFTERLESTPAIDLMLLLGHVLLEVGSQAELFEVITHGVGDDNPVLNISNDNSSVIAFVR